MFMMLNGSRLKINAYDLLTQIDHQLSVINASEVDFPRFNPQARSCAENEYSDIPTSNVTNVQMEKGLHQTGILI